MELGCIHSVYTPGCPRCDARKPKLVVRGKFFLWVETGHGGYAIQDEKFMYPPTEDYPHERWSYDGLHLIRDGDVLTAYNEDGSVYWDGVIHMEPTGCRPILAKTLWQKFKNLFSSFPLPTNKQWGKIFMGELKGTLYRA
jgi:hypothetical protein